MLDSFGIVVIAAVIALNVNALIGTMPVMRSTRLALAAATGAWIGVAAAAAARGSLAVSMPFPVIGLFAALPIAATALLAALAPSFRTALLGVPLPLLIGLNVSRVFGAFFLLLAAAGRLGGPFPYAAAWGDIITGALALPLAWYAVRRPGSHIGVIGAWNVFGAADLIVAVTLGLTSATGSPWQLFDAGAGSAAMQALPWSLVPTVLVPFYLIMHGVIWAQLRSQHARRATSSMDFARGAA